MDLLLVATRGAAHGDRIVVLPEMWKFVILVVVVIELLATVYFLRRKWLETHDVLPLSGALAMMLAAMSLYMLVGSALYWTSPPPDRVPLLFWLFIFSIPLCFQNAMNVVNTFSWAAAQRIGPMGTQIGDTPSVAQARLLLREGRIEEAVVAYTEHFIHRSKALAEVARWLKSGERYDDAMVLYTEIVAHHGDDRAVWAEAAYNLGKIHETHLSEPRTAMSLYRRLLDEAPDSRFCHLAGTDLARLQVLDPEYFASLASDDSVSDYEDPFFAQRMALLRSRMIDENDDAAESEGGEKQTVTDVPALGKRPKRAPSKKATTKSPVKKRAAPKTPAKKKAVATGVKEAASSKSKPAPKKKQATKAKTAAGVKRKKSAPPPSATTE